MTTRTIYGVTLASRPHCRTLCNSQQKSKIDRLAWYANPKIIGYLFGPYSIRERVSRKFIYKSNCHVQIDRIFQGMPQHTLPRGVVLHFFRYGYWQFCAQIRSEPIWWYSGLLLSVTLGSCVSITLKLQSIIPTFKSFIISDKLEVAFFFSYE